MGTKGPKTGYPRHECQGGFAFKMLRDELVCEAYAGPMHAVATAQLEVRRLIAIGSHPNLVRLVDVNLFWQPGLHSAHVGLVFDLFEIDGRHFLKSNFTHSGIRHVLTSVLEALAFIHAGGCVHCDLKPASIFLRGAVHLRGCFDEKGGGRYNSSATGTQRRRPPTAGLDWNSTHIGSSTIDF